MADTVQRLLERTVPELEELQVLGVFTKSEIKSIVKRRTDFEYRLQARAPEKQDYLRYIEYEHNLDSLHKKRKKRLGLRGTSSVDFAGERRIHMIFTRALMKFQSDLALWMEYIEYSVSSKNSSRLAKIFPKALRLHPKSSELWIKAAVFEFSHNQNVATARIYMQRALRLNERDKRIWSEYFKLEVEYCRVVRSRRDLLGLAKTGSNADAKISADAGKEKNLNELKLDSLSPNATPESRSEPAAATKEFLRGAVPGIVYSNACKALDGVASIDFHTDILNACGSDFPWLENLIITQCMKKFSDAVEFWSAYASVPSISSQEREKRFRKGLDTVASPAMWSSYLLWCMQTDLSPEKLLSLFLEAHAVCLLEDHMYRQWVRVKLLHSQTYDAEKQTKRRKIAKFDGKGNEERSDTSTLSARDIARAATDRHPQSPISWKLLILTEERYILTENAASSGCLEFMETIFSAATSKIDPNNEDSWDIELLWTKYCVDHKPESSLVAHIKDTFRRFGRRSYNDSQVEKYVESIEEFLDAERFRHIFKFALKTGVVFRQGVPSSIFKIAVQKHCDELKNGNLSKAEFRVCLKSCRSTLESFVTTHAKLQDSWLQYARFEKHFGDLASYMRVDGRARISVNKGAGEENEWDQIVTSNLTLNLK